jgi:hypothetical protein
MVLKGEVRTVDGQGHASAVASGPVRSAAIPQLGRGWQEEAKRGHPNRSEAFVRERPSADWTDALDRG